MAEYDLALIPARAGARGLVERGGAGARLAVEEFFLAKVRNPHTRRAYGRHVNQARYVPKLAGRPGPPAEDA